MTHKYFGSAQFRKIIGLSLLANLPVTAIAQDSTYVIEEVIVTAQKREQRQIEVPMTVNAISGDQLKNTATFDFAEVQKQLAGISLDSDGGVDTKISIRGVGNGSLDINDQTVAVFVDGIVQSEINSVFNSLLDVERVEILRGPQGTLYGKNAPSGAVNVWTRNPHTDGFEGEVEHTQSSYKTQESRVTANLPIIEDTLAARVGLIYADSDGFIDNETLDTKARSQQTRGGQAKVLWTPTTTLDVALLSKHLETDGTYVNSVQAGPSSGGSVPAGTTIYDYKVYDNTKGVTESRDSMTGLTIDKELESGTVTAVFGYQKYNNQSKRDQDGSADGNDFIDVDVTSETITQETRFTSAGDNRFDYMVGTFASKQRRTSLALIEVNNGAFVSRSPAQTVNKSYGLFSNNNFELRDKLELIFGLRYTQDKKSSTNEQITSQPALTSPENTKSRKFENWSGSIKLSWLPDDDTNYYISLDRAYRAGGFSPNLPSTYTNANYDEYDTEKSTAFEIGFKKQLLDNRLKVGGAIYQQVYQDFQQSIVSTERAVQFAPGVFVALTTGTSQVYNFNDAKSFGGEIDFTYLPSANWLINGALSYNKVELDATSGIPTTFSDAGFTTAPVPGASLVFGADSSTIPTRSDPEGDLGAAPNFSATLTVEYRSAWEAAQMNWFVRALGTKNGARDSDRDLFEPYQTLDVYVGLSPYSESWRLVAWIKNLTDAEYAYSGFSGDANQTTQALPAAPKSYGVTASMKF